MTHGVNNPVTIVGLNARGAALARALAVHTRVTVWDGAGHRSEAPHIEGVSRAGSAAEAFTASPLAVLCGDDYDHVHRVLETAEPHVSSVDVVNLTSGTGDQAEQVAAWLGARGVDYLDGALMAHPEHVGDPDTVLVLSGSRPVFDRHAAVLARLGSPTYLGSDPGAAALYDVAMLNFAWSTLLGFLETAALLGTAGVSATSVSPLLTRWLSGTVAEVITGYASQVDDRRYPGDQDWLELDAPLMDHLVEAARARGIDTALPELIRSLTAKGIEAGHGRASFASLVEVLRV
ncbi:NAD(P)-dependent oxidoreductase [Nocardiopsis ganjiahuensis]|uniref:NAD(P)-dependent oxidoreductase n=1 Tax=Nocardiopsis ganjiahuensis TaxID=239984 RepID=UPI00034D3916|nr:NAD(P)-binding domain-containing protein [Nocardiopsis ganjiahuensis]